MPQINFNIPINLPSDMTAAQALDHFCDDFGYENRKLAEETKAEFAKRMGGEFYASAIVRNKRLKDAQAIVSPNVTVG